MHHILVCDDEADIVAALKIYLESDGYCVHTACCGADALRIAKEEPVQLALLDIMMPGIDGITTMAKLREFSNIPVILLTAKSEDSDKILGLSVGADDYITKPFSPSELVARVTAHIARYERLTSKGEEPVNYVINVGKLSIDTHARRVFVNEKEVTLTNKEFDLLAFLASNPNVVYSKDDIFDKIWGLDAIGETSTVTVHINRIRDKIEADSSNPQYIETVWGAGYRFKA